MKYRRKKPRSVRLLSTSICLYLAVVCLPFSHAVSSLVWFFFSFSSSASTSILRLVSAKASCKQIKKSTKFLRKLLASKILA